jgi:hypothetical protein
MSSLSETVIANICGQTDISEIALVGQFLKSLSSRLAEIYDIKVSPFRYLKIGNDLYIL